MAVRRYSLKEKNMIKIKYNDSNTFYDVGFSRTENTVTLKGNTEVNPSGFTTWKSDRKT